MAFNGRNPNGQRKSFFMRLKTGISNIPDIYHKHQETARFEAAKQLAKHNESLKLEEVRVANELKLAQEDVAHERNIEASKAKIEEANQQKKELAQLRFEHSTAGKALASFERGASKVGSGIKTGAQKAGSGLYTAAAFVQPYAKKALGVGQRAEGGRRRRRKVSRTISFAPSGTVVRARVKRLVKKKRRGGGSSGFGDIVGTLG